MPFPPQEDRQPAGEYARQGAKPQRNAHPTGHHFDLEHQAEELGEGHQGEKDHGDPCHGFQGTLRLMFTDSILDLRASVPRPQCRRHRLLQRRPIQTQEEV